MLRKNQSNAINISINNNFDSGIHYHLLVPVNLG